MSAKTLRRFWPFVTFTIILWIVALFTVRPLCIRIFDGAWPPPVAIKDVIGAIFGGLTCGAVMWKLTTWPTETK